MRTIVMFAIMLATSGALATVTLVAATTSIDEADNLRARGVGVVVVRSDGPLSSGPCDALGRLSGFVASGGVVSEAIGEAFPSGGQNYNFARVSGEVLALWQNQPLRTVGTGWSVGMSAATELGLALGSHLNSPTLDLGGRVDEVMDFTLRKPASNRSIFYRVAGPADLVECWVEFELPPDAMALTALRGYFESAGVLTRVPPRFEVVPLLRTDDTTRDPLEDFTSRLSRGAWLWASAVTSLVYLLLTWLRRRDVALYRSLGTPRHGLVVIGLTEIVLVLLSGIATGTVGSLLWFSMSGQLSADVARIVAVDSLRLALWTLVLSTASWPLIGSLSIHRQLRVH